ncbi:MAG TPA: pentapeptide repeat-containing protein, partial [Aggregatilinea sp.]|uniref:pentapeptide repeat-containing protein n=1 Tax=Aggregatilinea sp. TaxID=2806333 RepID=UPI002C0D96DC
MSDSRRRKLTPGKWWRMLDHTSQQILMVLIGVAVASVIPAVIISGDWAGLFLNLGTELAGASITFVLLDQILGTSRTKASLLAQMGSRMNDEATRAVEELRRLGWLSDGVLRGADLAGANLQGARLSQATMPRAVLEGAKLQRAVLGR